MLPRQTMGAEKTRRRERDAETHLNDAKLEQEDVDMVDGRITFLWYRLLKQGCLFSLWISLGLVLEIIGPTIPDLKDTIGINYEEIARALSLKAFGLTVGSIAGGFLHEFYYKQTDLIMSIGMLLGAVGIAGVPWVRSLGGLAVMLSLTGIHEGLINTGGHTMTMHLWGKHAAPPMHYVALGFGIGAFLAPQLARPFLSGDRLHGNASSSLDAENTSSSLYATTTQLVSSNMTDSVVVSDARLVYPYSIIAVITAVLAIFMGMFYVMGPPKGFPTRASNKNIRQLLSPGSCSSGDTLYSTALLICLFVFFLQTVGGERAYGKFLFSYAIDAGVDFSKNDAAMLSSVFWGCHLTGRFLGIIITRYIKVQYVIFGDIVGGLITSIILSIFAYDNATVLWALSGFMGFFISLLFPCGMSWANLYLEMNSMATMVLMVGASAGGLVYQYLPGWLFEEHGVGALMYVMIAYSLGSLLIYGIMQGVGSTKGTRYDRAIKPKSETNEKELEIFVEARI